MNTKFSYPLSFIQVLFKISNKCCLNKCDSKNLYFYLYNVKRRIIKTFTNRKNHRIKGENC